MKIYLSGSLSKADVMKKIRHDLEGMGHRITSRWIDRPFIEFKPENASLMAHQTTEDLADIVLSDVILIFSNNGGISKGGRHVELGFALAQGVKVFFIGIPENGFHYLPQVRCFADYRDFMYWFSRGS